MRQVVKLLFSKVPRYAACSDEELEELATRSELQFAPQLYCVRRKGSQVAKPVFEGTMALNAAAAQEAEAAKRAEQASGIGSPGGQSTTSS